MALIRRLEYQINLKSRRNPTSSRLEMDNEEAITRVRSQRGRRCGEVDIWPAPTADDTTTISHCPVMGIWYCYAIFKSVGISSIYLLFQLIWWVTSVRRLSTQKKTHLTVRYIIEELVLCRKIPICLSNKKIKFLSVNLICTVICIYLHHIRCRISRLTHNIFRDTYILRLNKKGRHMKWISGFKR